MGILFGFEDTEDVNLTAQMFDGVSGRRQDSLQDFEVGILISSMISSLAMEKPALKNNPATLLFICISAQSKQAQQHALAKVMSLQ